MKRITALLLQFCLLSLSYAQDRSECPQLPAPCPYDATIGRTNDAASRTKDNSVFLPETEMEALVRERVTAEVERVAKAHGWTVYELNEEGLDGAPFIDISYNEWTATPFNRRPPHYYQISFIFLINKDSLQAWKDWELNDLQKKSDLAVAQYSQSQNSNPLLTRYQDSIAYFSAQFGILMQNDFPAYQKDLQNRNQKGIDAYERRQKRIQEGMDRVQKKAEAIQTGADKGFDDLYNNEINPKMVAFAESAMGLIHFYINPYTADFALDNGATPQRTITMPGAFYAGVTTNRGPADRHSYQIQFRGFYFNNPSCVATVLFGDYLARNGENNYPASFTKSFTTGRIAIASVKKISCDKVQNVLAHVEGRSSTVNAILRTFDWSKLSALLYKP